MKGIALNNRWLTPKEVGVRAKELSKNSYGNYLINLIK
jgi:hypothetical protein